MANKGAPSGMLSIVDRRCAWSETGSQEKGRSGRAGSGEGTGGKDIKKQKVRSDWEMKGNEE